MAEAVRPSKLGLKNHGAPVGAPLRSAKNSMILRVPKTVTPAPMAASAAGDTADAHYYMAEYHLMVGDLSMAADQLRLALSIPGLDSVQRARFESRLRKILEFQSIARNRQRSTRNEQD